VDSQAAITAILQPEQQSGQYILHNIHNKLKKAQEERPHLTFHIEWVPGHSDIEGNNKVDEEAKQAAKENLQGETPIKVYKLKSSQIMAMNVEIERKTAELWNTKNVTTGWRRTTKAQATTQLRNSLTRKQGATLTQLRTGHYGLNQYLHGFNIIDDPHCECGHGIETVKHFLLDCRMHENATKELRETVGWRNMRVQTLLGDLKLVNDTMEYVEKTGRLKFRNLK